jgi:hypothetical protein
MTTGAGSVLRWTGSSFLWLCAPAIGLFALNLPTFLIWRAHDPASAAQVTASFAWGALLIVLWVIGVFWLARLHQGRNRRTHLTWSFALFALGLASPLLYALILFVGFTFFARS